MKSLHPFDPKNLEMDIRQFKKIGEFSWMKQKVADQGYRVKNLIFQTADPEKIQLR
jgi:hypothetical protein